MKFYAPAIAALLATVAPVAKAATTSVSYDQTYDNANQSLATVACSDGINGLLSQGAPPFPRQARPC